MPSSPPDALYSHFIESTDVLTELYYSQLRRPRTANTSHYRPHSVVVAEQEALKSQPLSRSRSSYKSKPSAVSRPLSIMGFGIKKTPSEAQSASSSNPKRDYRPPAPSRLASSLKSRKSYTTPEAAGRSPSVSSTVYFDRPKILPIAKNEIQVETVEKSFTERLFWSQKNGQMFLHPYSSQNVSYMVAYDRILMQSDHYTSSLLQRLNENGSPSFHDYGKKPPGSVLDLGCGDMYWAIDQAAVAWKKTQITAFDLVNAPAMLRADDDRPIPENVRFVQGDFINHPLPFQSAAFDMVRMANLTLAIPYEKWAFVLGEVNRVLKSGGRVEIIDDHMFFPYGSAPGPKHSLWHHSSTSLSSAATSDTNWNASRLSDSESNQPPFHPTRPFPAPPLSPVELAGRLEEWHSMASLAMDLECVFGAMLARQYGIHSRPYEFIPDMLSNIFGKGNAKKIRTLHLKLAPCSDFSKEEDRASMNSTDSGYVSAANPTKSDDKKSIRAKAAVKVDDLVASIFVETSASPRPPSPIHRRTPSWASSQSQLTDISSKAADRLGIDLATLPQTSGRRSRPISADSSQSPGLVLHPSTFIPINPTELEMHTCRHMHILLGCKSALLDYLTQQVDEEGNQVVTHADVEDALWKYECFRRARFNWPLDPPNDLEFNSKSHQGSTGSLKGLRRVNSISKQSTMSARSDPVETPIPVRTFRVFEATKM